MPKSPVVLALVLACSAAAVRADSSSFRCAAPPPSAFAAKTADGSLTARGSLAALVLFARFADEGTAEVPGFARDLFDPQRRGSFSHFYRTMSHGQLRVGGTVLPQRYASARPAAAYRSADPTQSGTYGDFVKEVLAAADSDTDFGRFDNNGPDGVPNSGDDDGIVDYLFVNMRRVPTNFLLGPATGISGLGFDGFYETGDTAPNGQPIRIAGTPSRGTVLQEGTYAQTVGVMAHEFGHSLGLPDLFDTSFLQAPGQAPADDGAGIGRWGLMGLGALGWNDNDGPVGFSAWSLEQLGWIGPGNERLHLLEGGAEGLRIDDLFAGGQIYKLPLQAESPDNATIVRDYLLLEQRTRATHHYNRNLPAEGLLVWHVRDRAGSNADERSKGVDLVCADGLYTDAGFPAGRIAAPSGGDNLDFWAHDEAYRLANSGNTGDATDPFDGVRFTRLTARTNPSTHLGTAPLSEAQTGLSLENMRRDGEAMRLDVRPDRWAGTIREQVEWVGTVWVDGDLTVAPEGGLSIGRRTQVRIAGTDRLQGGLDPERIEIKIEGDFVLPRPIWSISGGAAVFAAAEKGDTWYGLLIESAPGSRLSIPVGSLNLFDSLEGTIRSEQPTAVEDLTVRNLRFFDGLAPETAGDGSGHIGRGETFQVGFDLHNNGWASFDGLILEMEWQDEVLSPAWGQTANSLRLDGVTVAARGQRPVRFPALTLATDARPGQVIALPVQATALEAGTRRLVWRDTLSLRVSAAAPLPRLPLKPSANGEPGRDGAVLSAPWVSGSVRAELPTEGALGVDLIVHNLKDLEHLATVRMKNLPGGSGRSYVAPFRPPRPGQYLYSFRVRTSKGAYLSPTRLQNVALLSSWEEALLLLEPDVRAERNRLEAAVAQVVADMGRRTTLLDLRQKLPGGGLAYDAVLNHYLEPGRLVVWAGEDLTADAEAAFNRFLVRGGRLLLLQDVRAGSQALLPGLNAARSMKVSAGTRLVEAGNDAVKLGLADAVTIYARPSGTDSVAVPLINRKTEKDTAESALDFGRLALHGAFELAPPAQPLLFNDRNLVAGLRLDAGTYRLVYIPVPTYGLGTGAIRQLLEPGLRFLGDDTSAQLVLGGARLQILADLEDNQGLHPVRPDITLSNRGDRPSSPFRVGYQVLRQERVLFAAESIQPPLAAGAQRRITLEDWIPEREGDIEIRFGLAADAQTDLSYIAAHPLEVVRLNAYPSPAFSARPLDGDLSGGNGAASFDYDGDGDLDLYLARRDGPNLLFRNQGGVFAETGVVTGVADGERSRGLAYADYDGDGDLDLYLVNEGENRLYRNDANRYRDASRALDAPGSAASLADPASGRSAAFFDFDNDFDLDLYVTNTLAPNRLFENRGGDFDETAAAAGLADEGGSKGLAVGDYDNDGDLDLFVANQTSNRPSRLYRNEGAAFVALTVDAPRRGDVAAAFADYDNDGDSDLFVANQNTENRLYLNDRGNFSRVPPQAGGDLGASSVGLALLDYDNDGDLDLFTTAVSPEAGGDDLFANRGGAFVRLGPDSGLRPQSQGRAITFGDYDGDGDQDLLVADEKQTQLYTNNVGGGGWLHVSLGGPAANPQAIGAKITLWSAGRRQTREVQPSYGYCSLTHAALHFGLGQAGLVDSLRAIWPDGRQVMRRNLDTNRRLHLAYPGQGARKNAAPALALLPNRPNPFNAQTQIRFSLDRAAHVELGVYNLAGQRLALLADNQRPAGAHTVTWSGRDQEGRPAASGVYLYRLRLGQRVLEGKMLLLR